MINPDAVNLSRVLAGELKIPELDEAEGRKVVAALKEKADEQALSALAANITFRVGPLKYSMNLLNGSNPCYSALVARGHESTPIICQRILTFAGTATSEGNDLMLLGLCLGQIEGLDKSIEILGDLKSKATVDSQREAIQQIESYTAFRKAGLDRSMAGRTKTK